VLEQSLEHRQPGQLALPWRLRPRLERQLAVQVLVVQVLAG